MRKPGLIARVKHLFGLRQDAGSGDWIDVSWPLSFWQQDLKAPGNANGVVHACVQAYAQTIAPLPIHHYRRLPAGGREMVTDSVASSVLRRPNRYQTQSDLLLNLVHGLLYEGNAYGIGVRDRRERITEIHLAPPRNSSARVDAESGDVFYWVSPEDVSGLDGALIVPQRNMMHIRLHCPVHPLRGETPLTAAAVAVGINNRIGGHQISFYENMSRPSGVLATDLTMTSADKDELRKYWNDRSTQLNSGGVPILSHGLKWQSLSLSANDSQIIEAQKMSIEDIARVYRVPLPILGVTENSSYNNVHGLISYWKASGLGFLLGHIEQGLEVLFGLPEDEYIEFSTDALLRTDMQSRVEALTTGITGGLFAPNEARAREMLPPVDGGDMPRVQQQMIPLDSDPGADEDVDVTRAVRNMIEKAML